MQPEQRDLGRLRPNPLVTRNDREAAGGDFGNPLCVECAERRFRDQFVARVNDVASCHGERLPEAKRTLIDEQAEACQVGRHGKLGRDRLAADQLVADGGFYPWLR